jgi:hypothetical protein
MTETKTPKVPVVPKFDPLLGVFVDSKTGIPIPKKLATRPAPVSPIDFKIDARSVFEKDQAMLGPVVHKDENGFLIQNAGKKSLPISPRKTYRKGTFWVVVEPNVRVEAMCHYGQASNGGAIWSGWSRRTPVGTVLECIGWRRFRKDGLVAPQFVYPELPHEARYSQVWPMDSVFRPWPLEGILEPVLIWNPDTDDIEEYNKAGHVHGAVTNVCLKRRSGPHCNTLPEEVEL